MLLAWGWGYGVVSGRFFRVTGQLNTYELLRNARGGRRLVHLLLAPRNARFYAGGGFPSVRRLQRFQNGGTRDVKVCVRASIGLAGPIGMFLTNSGTVLRFSAVNHCGIVLVRKTRTRVRTDGCTIIFMGGTNNGMVARGSRATHML